MFIISVPQLIFLRCTMFLKVSPSDQGRPRLLRISQNGRRCFRTHLPSYPHFKDDRHGYGCTEPQTSHCHNMYHLQKQGALCACLASPVRLFPVNEILVLVESLQLWGRYKVLWYSIRTEGRGGDQFKIHLPTLTTCLAATWSSSVRRRLVLHSTDGGGCIFSNMSLPHTVLY